MEDEELINWLLQNRIVLKTMLGIWPGMVFSFCNAQNLVPNPSFEDTIVCPTACLISECQNWYSATNGTPDYYNSCGTCILNAGPNFRSGNASSGIFLYNPPGIDIREYLEVELTDTLESGVEYCVEYYVRLLNTAAYAVNNAGAYFTSTSIFQSGTTNLNVVPQIQNTNANPLTDTVNWTRISGSFTAGGGEKFMLIGNFSNDINSDIVLIDTNNSLSSYYHIDDVSVTICPDPEPTPNSYFVPTAFSPNGDNNNDVLFVRGNNIANIDFHVFDRWGQEVFKSENQTDGWDGTFKGNKLNHAVFMYYCNITYTDGKTEVVKGNVTLVR